jgi:hypothetical protein
MTTAFFGVELGVTYLELQDILDPSTRAAWANSHQRQREPAPVQDMWLAWRITGAQRFADAYESPWSFTVAAPQLRWAGFGLQVSGDSGSLAESTASDTPGFGPWYTTVQLDTATELWILTHDDRYLRLMNLEVNAELPLIDADWMLDATTAARGPTSRPASRARSRGWRPSCRTPATTTTRPCTRA